MILFSEDTNNIYIINIFQSKKMLKSFHYTLQTEIIPTLE